MVPAEIIVLALTETAGAVAVRVAPALVEILPSTVTLFPALKETEESPETLPVFSLRANTLRAVPAPSVSVDPVAT